MMPRVLVRPPPRWPGWMPVLRVSPIADTPQRANWPRTADRLVGSSLPGLGVSVRTEVALHDWEEDLLASSFTPLGGLLHVLAMGCAGEIGGRRVSGWFHHWVIVDFYDPVWPNIAASILCAVWAVRRIKIHLKRHHQLVLRHFAFLHEKSDDFNSGTAFRVGAINGVNTSGGDWERPHERT